MKKKITEWAKRYVPAEIFALFGVLLGASLTFYFTQNRVLAAFIGTISEVCAFFLYMATKDIFDNRRLYKKTNRNYGFLAFFKTIRNLIVEFGPAEVFDNFIVRPISLYIFPLILNNYTFGIIIGKFAADIIYYLFTIIFYEIRKKYLTN